ncbi:MAG: hypothetical protein V4487_07490 [Chlamydiota bacterium]
MPSCPAIFSNEVPIERLPKGWVTARVHFRHRDGRADSYIEIVHLKNNNRFLHEPMLLTSLKCAGLIFLSAVYFGAYEIFHLVRTPLTAINVIGTSFANLVCSPNWKNVKQLLVDVAWTAPKCIFIGIWTLVRAPFYCIGMMFSALFGIFKPLEGRELLGEVEAAWHQKTIREDLMHLEDDNWIWPAFADKDFRYTSFIAVCMQPHGKTTDPHILGPVEVLQPS